MLSPKVIDTLTCEKMSFRVFVKAAGLPSYSLYGGTRHSFAAMCRLIGMPPDRLATYRG